jgi:short-subunit dehydrogenase
MKNVMITGATKGIGRAIVEQLAADGYNIAMCSRTLQDLEDLQAGLCARYPNQKFLIRQVDVRDKASLENFAMYVETNFQSIDVLINNAGIFLPGTICEEEDGRLELQLETNLYSAYYLTRAIVPIMRINKSGLIINMCSIASKIAYPNGGSYSISKFAMYGMTKVLREELKGSRIAVTAILPGATWSDSWTGVDLPKDRLMPASDIAKVVATAISLEPASVMEEIILRPQLGDL